MRLGASALVLVCQAACGRDEPPRSAAPLASDEPTPTFALPRPAPQHRSEAFEVAKVNAACESCHPVEATEWRGSLHQQSWQDPVFFKAYTLEAQPFCRACHAPEADPHQRPDSAAVSVGVGCVTCHVQQGQILGPRASTGGPHQTVADTRLESSEACTNCHDFDFPGRPGLAMQATGREHQVSTAASQSCQECHMTLEQATGRKRHDFRVVGNPSKLAEALTIEAVLEDAHTVTFRLRAKSIGHALPTGDLFRRVELQAACTFPDGHTERVDPMVFARGFSGRGFGGARDADIANLDRSSEYSTLTPPTATSDRRLFLDADHAVTQVSMTFGEPVFGGRIHYRLVHRRMDDAMAAFYRVVPNENDTVMLEGELDLRVTKD